MNLENCYRQATKEEVDFYQQKLYPLQNEVFMIASNYEEEIYLTKD